MPFKQRKAVCRVIQFPFFAIGISGYYIIKFMQGQSLSALEEVPRSTTDSFKELTPDESRRGLLYHNGILSRKCKRLGIETKKDED